MQTFQKTFLLFAILLSSCFNFALVTAQQQGNTAVKTSNENSSLSSDTNDSSNNAQSTAAEEVFHSMDTNHDSSLSLSEFITNFSMMNTHPKTSINLKQSSSGGGFWNGFSSSTMMIIATEIGDKTFFIAAVLSMRNSRLVVFGGAIGALICMTVLSTMMGLVLPSIMPKQYTHIIGGILFLYFGIKLIYESRSMSNKVSDELEEVEEELLQHNKKSDLDIESSGSGIGNDASSSQLSSPKSIAENQKLFVQSFLLTFLAEWGDRSQIATIALAAAKNPYGVTIGGCLGHSLCTGMAVIGGRMLASKISEKTVSFWGGVIFLLFGVHSLFFDE